MSEIPLEIIPIIFSYLPKKTRIVNISYFMSKTESYRTPATRIFFAKTIHNSNYTTWSSRLNKIKKFKLNILNFSNKEYDFSGSFCSICGDYSRIFIGNKITKNICKCSLKSLRN